MKTSFKIVSLLIWQGRGDGIVNFDSKKREAMIEKNIAKILMGYPPENKETKK